MEPADLAERERLQKELAIRQEFTLSVQERLGEELDEVRSENERLRAALAMFAEESAWWQGAPQGSLPGSWIEVGGKMRRPWTVAQEVLAKLAEAGSYGWVSDGEATTVQDDLLPPGATE